MGWTPIIPARATVLTTTLRVRILSATRKQPSDGSTHAAVFSVDEKTAIQALDRLDPVLPLSAGRAARHGFEYYRHGTLFLHAALDTKTSRVHGKTAAPHTSRDFVAFLGRSGVVVPAPAADSYHPRQPLRS